MNTDVLMEAFAFIAKEGSLKGFSQIKELNNLLEEKDWWISEATGRLVVESEQGFASRRRIAENKEERQEIAFWARAHAAQMRSFTRKGW